MNQTFDKSDSTPPKSTDHSSSPPNDYGGGNEPDTSSTEAKGSPKGPSVHSKSALDLDVPDSRPDYDLPRDHYDLPYGPFGRDFKAMGKEADLWDDAYTYWIICEATPAEKLFANRRDNFVLKAVGLINRARMRKHPSMPTLSGIDYRKLPRNMDGILSLWKDLNEAEREYVGSLQSVPEWYSNYPTKTDCFSPRDGKFYRKNGSGFVKLNFTQYQEQLAAEGYDIGGRRKVTRDSEVSKIIQRVTLRQVTVMERLSGMDQGYHNLGVGAGEYLACVACVSKGRRRQGTYDHRLPWRVDRFHVRLRRTVR